MNTSSSTHTPRHIPWLALSLIALMSALLFWGIRFIPFHPDESTQLYMSSDFELLWNDPLSMNWQPQNEGDLRQHYRELDAPLTRYLLGLGRTLAQQSALPVDWDWSRSWEENREAGALPEPGLLATGRLTITSLLPVSLLLVYLIGRRIGGEFAGALAILLFGLNALVMLHARRAMAEGTLILGICLCSWAFLDGDKRPWLAGVGMALAFNAKQTALALFPVGLLAVCWTISQKTHSVKSIMMASAQFVLASALITFALNPLWWRNPIEAIRGSWLARQDLLSRQTADVRRLAPEQLMETPVERSIALLANLFIRPPAFAEVGNYLAQTAQAEAQYMAFPGHNLMRGFVGGGIMLTLTWFGFLVAILQVRRAPTKLRRELVLLMLASIAQTAFILTTVPLIWQRYVMPLVPYTCLWAAYALNLILPHPWKRTAPL